MPVPSNETTEQDVLAVISAEAEAQAQAEAARRKADEDKRLLQRWSTKIANAREHDSDARAAYAEERRIARGDTGWLVDTNLVGAIIEILMAFCYAKDPDVSVRPSVAVSPLRVGKVTMLTKTLEIMLTRMMKKARLKTQAKRWVRSAMTIGIGWLKASMQTRIERDPIVENEINTLKQNLARLDLLQADLEAGEAKDPEAQRAEIRAQMEALEKRLEREFAEGAIVDFLAGEDVIVAPECGELENYLASPWIATDAYKSVEDARLLCDWGVDDQEFRRCIQNANRFLQRPRRGEENKGVGSSVQYVPIPADKQTESTDGFVRITEIQSKRDGVIYTLIDGVDRWARQPYAPHQSERFYNLFQLAFHYNDQDRHPQSDVKQLAKLQDEFGRTRSNFAEHRRRAIPATFFDEQQIDADTIRKVKDAESNEFIGVKTINGGPMQNAFYPKPYPQVDPMLYSTDAIRVDMEKMSGAQDAQQGSVAVEKTLGEAEIQQSGFMARTGARKDAIEDALNELYEYFAQLSFQLFDQASAQKLAGPEAVWAQLTLDEVALMVDVEIKAGSTGKPKNSMDKQTWGTLLPLLQTLIDKVGQARLQGQEWAAKPWIALLRETALRLDDRIDIEALLPVVPPPAPVPGMPGAAPGGLPLPAGLATGSPVPEAAVPAV